MGLPYSLVIVTGALPAGGLARLLPLPRTITAGQGGVRDGAGHKKDEEFGDKGFLGRVAGIDRERVAVSSCDDRRQLSPGELARLVA